MRLYYGWRIVILAAVIYILVFGSTVSSFSLYVVPVSAEFGLSRAEMNSAFVLINVGSAIWAPFIGRALDRFPLKLILGVSALLIGAGFITLSLSHWIWLSMMALAIGIAIGLDGAAMLTMTVLVARWFKVHRARAMTLAVTGQAMGKVIVPVPTVLLMEAFGWRTALFVTGLVLIIFLMLVAILVRERPRPGELEPGATDQAAAVAERPASVGYFLKMPQFWLIAVSIALTFGISATFAISVVPLGLDYGLTMTQGAFMASAYAGAAVAAKLLLAVFADRIDRFNLIIGLLVVGIPLSATFLLIHSPVQLFIFVTLLGLSVGGFAALFPVLQADVFGLASYGTLRGLMIPIQSAFVALGAVGAGEIHDIWGSYDMMFVAFAVVQAVVVVMLSAARPAMPPLPNAGQQVA
ncbi:MFS transporter [Sphingobium estronivorans]|uniref:MFS transporter n=1 Tax=Sphingobium estronivorans TaxID=1577690 RepID=UPI0013C33F7B|nr:MFS transporter [Sphingobium estronivorans]